MTDNYKDSHHWGSAAEHGGLGPEDSDERPRMVNLGL